MRFAMLVAFLLLGTAILAATNEMKAVCPSSTNVVTVKVSRTESMLSRPQCEAMTLSGNRCKRHAVEGSKYCSQHATILRKREKKLEGVPAKLFRNTRNNSK